jgi:branched-chain amino acid transport system permease protein
MLLLIQQAVNGVMVGAVYVTMAVAFTLTIGVLNFLNFTIPALFMVTGMVAWSLLHNGLPFGLSGPVNWMVALAVGILCAMLIALLVERFSYRYLKARFGDATEHAIPIVSSLGFLLIIENLVRIQFGTDTHGFETPLRGLSFSVAGLLISLPQVVSLMMSLLLVFALTWLLRASKVGRAIRAIAENPDAAMVVGVDVRRIVPVVFLASGLLCGVAAAIYAANYGQVSPAMGDDIGSKAIAGMVLGGLGSIWGAIAGGLMVGLIEAFSIQVFGSDAIQVSVWGLLLLVLLIRPQGLFGHHRIGKGKL